MGQKVNPIGFRLGTTRTWSSRWFASKRDYPQNLMEDVRIRKFIAKKFDSAGVSKVEIERAAKNLTINIHSDMAAYDALPADLRKAVGEAARCYSARQIGDLVDQRGQGWVMQMLHQIDADLQARSLR